VLTNLSKKEIVVDFGEEKQIKTYITSEHKNLGLMLQNFSKVRVPSRSVVTVLN
jgi:hypothetical protein